MTRRSIAEELENAADRIAEIARADLQIILRRAALMLRNVAGVPLDPMVADALDSIAAEMKHWPVRPHSDRAARVAGDQRLSAGAKD